LTAAIAARADDSAQGVRIAYNAKQILFFSIPFGLLR